MASATERAEKTEAQTKQHRAKQAAIVAGLQITLDPDEQLLAFARGKITGGWRGKFAIGLEAFFAPDVNVGLTERRFILQHIHATNGTPSDILPHKFPLEEIAALSFGDIETFGGEPAGRLVMRLQDEQHFRVKLAGALNCEDAAAMAEVFRSLTNARRKSGLTPTQSACPHCGHILDRPTKFCPYCGKTTAPDAPAADFHAETELSAPMEPMASAEETSPHDPEAGTYNTFVSSPFAAPDLSGTEAPAPFAEEVEPADPLAVNAPDPAPEMEDANAMTQDEAGDGLFPEIPIARSQDEPTLEMPAAPSDATPIAYDDAGVPTSEPDGGRADAGPGSAETMQNDAVPSPASAAFWREFARISGVATPEVLAQNAAAQTLETKAPEEEIAPKEAEKPAFPLAEEEN